MILGQLFHGTFDCLRGFASDVNFSMSVDVFILYVICTSGAQTLSTKNHVYSAIWSLEATKDQISAITELVSTE